MSVYTVNRIAAATIPAEPIWENTVQVSTEEELQTQIDAALAIPTQIQLLGSIVLTDGQINVPAAATIKLTSLGGPYALDASGGGRVLENEGTLYVAALTLENGFVSDHGGGVYNAGTFVLQDGGIITDNTLANGYSGGGLFNALGATFIMTGGEVRQNQAADIYIHGAGIANLGDFQMYGGIIHHNSTAADDEIGGDGAGVLNYGTFELYGGEIYNNAAANGGGVYGGTFTMYGGAVRDNAARTTYALASEGGGGVLAEDFTMRGGVISGNYALDLDNGGGVYVTPYGTTRIESGTIALNLTENDGGGIYVACENLDRLFVGADAAFSANVAARAFSRRQQDNAIYATHILSNSWTNPFTQGYNGYDIAYPCGIPFQESTEAVLSGQKQAVGASLPTGAFEFGVYDQLGTLVATATNGVNGQIVFPPIPAGSVGAHSYTIREIASSESGWIVDDTIFPATVTVIENPAGDIFTGVDYPDGSPSFTNTFQSGEVSATISGTKSAVGARLEAGQFKFGLYDAAQHRILTTTNDAQGRFAFERAFTEAGVYAYTVKELTPACKDWTIDTRTYPVIVTVESNALGQLTANVAYPEGVPAFVNRFHGAHPCPPHHAPHCPPVLRRASILPVAISECSRRRARNACRCATQPPTGWPPMNNPPIIIDNPNCRRI